MLWQILKDLLFPSQYMPHGYCYLWQVPLVSLHVISNLFIALAYFSIPALLLYFLRERSHTPITGLVRLFGAFILFCGVGHLIDIWTLWQPVYWLAGWERAGTAIVSCYTAGVLVTKIPIFLSLKSPDELEALNQTLMQEVAERKRAEAALAAMNRELEQRVQERTQALTESNAALGAEVQNRISSQQIIQARSQRLARQQWGLGEVVRREVIYSGDLTAAFQELNYLATTVLEVERVSIWLYNADRTELVCYDLYEKEADRHSSGTILLPSDYPSYFQAIHQDWVLVANDALSDPRLAELAENYLQPLQILAMLDTAVRSAGRVVGVLCLEHVGDRHTWEVDEQNFASYLATAVSLALDAYEGKRQQEALQEAKEMAVSANRAKSKFLANMSHELRTPLNAILGFTQLMVRDDSLPYQHRQPVEIINRSGQHLIDLINSILEMSQIEADRVSFEPEQFNLHTLFEGVCSLFEVKVANKGLTLSQQVEFERELDLVTDRKKLQQVLINLIGNALKFTHQGQIDLIAQILSGTDLPEDLQAKVQWPNPLTAAGDLHFPMVLRIDVRDTGPGIAPEELAVLFEAFSQTQTGIESGEGTGLGLSISQRLSRVMGGQIGVHSQVGQGTTFQIYLPVYGVAQAKDNTVSLKTYRIVKLAADQPPVRILIVEDRLENRLLLQELLSRVGFQELREALNGSEAVLQWELWQPHLILMDMRMPVMDGITATQEIRARLHRRQEAGEAVQTPVIIALTASAFANERQEMLSIGCDDFVSKPFQDDDLLGKIGLHLGLQFVRQVIQPAANARPIAALQPADLQVMPNPWLVQLWNACIQGNDLVLLDLLKQIPPKYDSLALQLRHLIHEFQFEDIIYLIDALKLEELSDRETV
ncbi:MAG: ATP-binding protein [Prochlorothrix sp.]